MPGSRGVGQGWLTLWAKSDAGGRPHSLQGHLLDSASVGELIWTEFLSARARALLDEFCQGRGRDVLVLMCGWHDLGKATPAFQAKVSHLAERGAARGFTLPPGRDGFGLKHGPSGALVAERVLRAAGASGVEWLPPIVDGHHGAFLYKKDSTYLGSDWQNGPAASQRLWRGAQEGLARELARSFNVDLSSLELDMPPHGVQLALAGLVSMADWIASSSLFPGLGEDPVTVEKARERASHAWQELGLHEGWSLTSPATADSFSLRHGSPPRPLQRLVMTIADAQDPSLIIVEAPTGEGKTEAAFAAAETLSARLGLGGFLFAMPTQGTTDAMFERCRQWSHSIDPELPLALLHGKAMANESWAALHESTTVEGVCDVEDDDVYGRTPTPAGSRQRAGVPSQWLLGRHRGLLSPAAVATVDQVLLMATQIKYVSLRMAGLLGKVLVIDEVHSYDVYMSQYLHQLLRWCSDARIPVILMSATLPPAQRRELVTAYAQGLAGEDQPELPDPQGYPNVTTWSPTEGARVEATMQARPDAVVSVSVADIQDPENTEDVAALAATLVAEGGCALVITNTVRRAQETYAVLRGLDVPAVLLHGRLTTAERARRTADLISRLGPLNGQRPDRVVVVATQIAEQSFDVDADVLITDLCPADLLVQRIGRLHRHERPGRPPRHRTPQVIVTGVRLSSGSPPRTPRAFEYVYDRYSLLRVAALLREGRVSLQLPSDTPRIVARAYDQAAPWPTGWAEEGELARDKVEQEREKRRDGAAIGLLTLPDRGWDEPTLRDLHADKGVERDEGRVAVRDGEPSVEVALVRATSGGELTTLDGSPLGPHGIRCTNAVIARKVLGDTVRVRHSEPFLAHMAPLPGWSDAPLLRDVKAVILDDTGLCRGVWGSVSYDEETGLTIDRAFQR